MENIQNVIENNGFVPDEIFKIMNKFKTLDPIQSTKEDYHYNVFVLIIDETYYYFNYTESQNKSFGVYQCKCCGKVFTINQNIKTKEVYELNQSFDRNRHLKNEKIEKQKNKQEYLKVLKEIHTSPIMKKRFEKSEAERPEYF